MIYPENFEYKIGFESLRGYLKERCLSPLGISEVERMQYSIDKSTIEHRLHETSEFASILNDALDFPTDFILDTTRSLSKLRVAGTYLSERELFDLKRSLVTIGDIAKFFRVEEDEEIKYPYLTELVADMQAFPNIINEIDSILDKFGNVKESASPELKNICRTLASTTSSINGILKRILAHGQQSGVLDKDVMPSMRDGRLVIPVSPMYKRKINGIVHDESATGKTVYIEPAEVVEANNTIREFEAEKRREIIKILTLVSAKIRPNIDELLSSYNILGKIDFTRAKAIAANELGGVLPNISDTQELEWYHAVHPILLLSLRSQGKEIIPMDITLNQKNRILIISGPNAGGKSVCLKTVGITQYMFQCGMLPCVYDNSHMSIFDNLFIDIGDEQSIEDDLSTYSSHLTSMKYFINNGTNGTIILIDEFGGGTEPQIGGAIAQSVLSKLNDKGMYGVITTHYQNLKHFAEDTNGLINGAMLYDRAEMRPLFQLSVGYPGNSFAIEIARKIGLPNDVILSAQDIVGSDYINMDKYLLDINRDRKYWNNKRQDIRVKEKKLSQLVEKYETEIESLSKERKTIIKEAKIEAKGILEQSNSSIERTIHNIKKVQADKEKTKDIRRQLEEFKVRIIESEIEDNESSIRKIAKTKDNRKHAQKKENVKKNVLKVGDNVTVEDSNTVGQILTIEGKRAIVIFGAMKTKIDLSRLKKSNKEATSNKDNNKSAALAYDENRQRQLNFKPDIDVRGMKSDEAIQAVTYFIDDAIQFNISRVRILHGTGTGILKQNIRAFLNTMSGVSSYRDEHVQFGGAGITIVDLI